MRHLNEMDFAASVKRWSDEGHQIRTIKAAMEGSKDDAGEGDLREAVTLVVKRHLEKNLELFFL